MSTSSISTARNSQAVARQQQEFPVLAASSLGDDRFIGFIAKQAKNPQRAQLVVTELSQHEANGFRLDRTLRDLLNMAKATLERHPVASRAF